MSHTSDFHQAGLGHIDGYGARSVVVKEAVIDTTGTARASTGLFVPEGAQIINMAIIVGATIPSAVTTVSVGHASDDDAFSTALTITRTANTRTSFADANTAGKQQALDNVGANTVLYTKLNRSQASMDLALRVEYINPPIPAEGSAAGSKPQDKSAE